MASYDSTVKNVVKTTEGIDNPTPQAARVVPVTNTTQPAPAATPTAPEATPVDDNMLGQIPKDTMLEWAPAEFKSFGRTTFISSDDLCRKIHAAFGETFHELVGCNCFPVMNGNNVNISLELYFEPNANECPTNKIRNLVDLTAPSNGPGLFDRVQSVQNKYNNKYYTLNPETRMLLSDFMMGGRKGNNYKDTSKWNKHISQMPLTTAGNPYLRIGAERCIVRVTGFDLRVVVRALFGDQMVISTKATADNNDTNTWAKARYDIRYNRNGPNNTFFMTIEQFDEGAIQEITARINPQPMQNNGFICY